MIVFVVVFVYVILCLFYFVSLFFVFIYTVLLFGLVLCVCVCCIVLFILVDFLSCVGDLLCSRIFVVMCHLPGFCVLCFLYSLFDSVPHSVSSVFVIDAPCSYPYFRFGIVSRVIVFML